VSEINSMKSLERFTKNMQIVNKQQLGLLTYISGLALEAESQKKDHVNLSIQVKATLYFIEKQLHSLEKSQDIKATNKEHIYNEMQAFFDNWLSKNNHAEEYKGNNSAALFTIKASASEKYFELLREALKAERIENYGAMSLFGEDEAKPPS
jgi:hypothetical protein